MLDKNRAEEALDVEICRTTEPACVDLVPVTPTLHRTPKQPVTRPDASFVAHLIAAATQAPQTRRVRRGSLMDAQNAYGTRPPQERRGVARRTRQII
jgi:hypothetical protein